jgi:hypothetical protein
VNTTRSGGEFVSRAIDAWAYAHDVRLNSHAFVPVGEVQQILDAWREDDNLVRPHSSLQDRTAAAVHIADRIELEIAVSPSRRSLRDYFAAVVLRGGSLKQYSVSAR